MDEYEGMDKYEEYESDGKKYKFSPKQYEILKACSEKKDMTEWNLWRQKNNHTQICLDGADFSPYKNNQGVYTHWDLRGGVFRNALFRGANFNKVLCCRAYFIATQCQGTDFRYANFCETKFLGAAVNSDTRFTGCKIDDSTDFSNTNLNSLIIEPSKQAKLEQIIRRKGWKKWFYTKERNAWNRFCMHQSWLEKEPPLSRKVSIITVLLCPHIKLLRLFWWISDYGYNTGRVLGLFFLSIALFASLYTIFPSMLALDKEPMPTTTMDILFQYTGVLHDRGDFVQMFAFATSTMVTLGFSNINVAITETGPHFWGMVTVTSNLMAGYFMLAVLVTRLAILFQTMGPGYVVPKKRQDGEK